MRWPNGGPPKLYAVIVNHNGKVLTFARKLERTTWLAVQHKRYKPDGYTLLTYQQQLK